MDHYSWPAMRFIIRASFKTPVGVLKLSGYNIIIKEKIKMKTLVQSSYILQVEGRERELVNIYS